MADHTFIAQVRSTDRTAILDMSGEINAFAEGALKEAYQQAVAAKPDAITLNFTQVDYINSTGIALIVGLLAEARKSNLPVRTFGLSDHYTEIFTITRLADFMTIYPDEGSAIKN